MASRKSMQRQVQYNRQTKAWQQNQMKKQMAAAGYANGAPKTPNTKQLRTAVIVAAVIILAISVLLIIKLKWWVGLLIGVAIAGAATGGFILYLKKKEEEVLRYYKAMGLPKNEFFKMMKKNSKTPLTQKQLNKMSKSWDKVQVK